jgi:hypothetical protein
VKRSPEEELIALIRSAKETFDGELIGYLRNMRELDDTETANAFLIFAEQTTRELSEITTFNKLEPLAIRQLTKLVRELTKAYCEKNTGQNGIVWLFCLIQLRRFVRAMKSGRIWRGVDEKISRRRMNSDLIDLDCDYWGELLFEEDPIGLVNIRV